jgi:hypothetical protein
VQVARHRQGQHCEFTYTAKVLCILQPGVQVRAPRSLFSLCFLPTYTHLTYLPVSTYLTNLPIYPNPVCLASSSVPRGPPRTGERPRGQGRRGTGRPSICTSRPRIYIYIYIYNMYVCMYVCMYECMYMPAECMGRPSIPDVQVRAPRPFEKRDGDGEAA